MLEFKFEIIAIIAEVFASQLARKSGSSEKTTIPTELMGIQH